MTNLVRNRCSNILELNLSHNLIEAEEFSRMMTQLNMERESSFGNLHFKLRILQLAENPMKQFETKIDKILTAYYLKRHQKLLIVSSKYKKYSESEII